MGCCFGCLKGQNDEKVEKGQSLHTGMLRERTDNVLDKYEVMERLGEGSMGSVSLVRIKEEAKGGSAFRTKEKKLGIFTKTKKSGSLKEKRAVQVDYALKTIILSRVSSEFVQELKNEISILRHMDHPNIVKAYEVYTRNWDISIIMELCSGGDLHARKPYSERDANSISKQLLSAVRYMHSQGIVHRDLKFENIMWSSATSDQIKVIDYGLSKKYLPSESKYMHEGVGTIYTMAPQVLQGVYTSQADLWSCGVISYMLLSSEKPFYSKRRRRVIDKIMRCDYNFNSPVWNLISDDAKNFVSSLIVLNPKERLNAKEALEHRWFTNVAALSSEVPPVELMEGIEASLMNYANASELKKVALNVIAHKSSAEEIVMMRTAFSHFDTGSDGYITFEEFRNALKECNLDDGTLNKVYNSMDVNKNGTVSYTEFLAAVLEARSNIEEERVADAFDRLDSDDTGYISKQDLASLLGRDKDSEDVQRLIREADTDQDGQISFQEFLAVFRKEERRLAHEVVSMNSNMNDDSAKLVGLDAKIPGGKFDKQSTN